MHIISSGKAAILAIAIAALSCSAGDSLSTVQNFIDNSSLPDAVKTFVRTNLAPVCVNDVVVKATEAQNAKGISLTEIKKQDDAWKVAEDFLPIQEEKLSNETAIFLQSLNKSFPAVLEAFAMDDQGAVVGESSLTSDYWQGDEAKWQNSFKEGKGGIDIGKLEYDASTDAELQQISLPVLNASGTVVGAVTFGLDLKKIK